MPPALPPGAAPRPSIRLQSTAINGTLPPTPGKAEPTRAHSIPGGIIFPVAINGREHHELRDGDPVSEQTQRGGARGVGKPGTGSARRPRDRRWRTPRCGATSPNPYPPRSRSPTTPYAKRWLRSSTTPTRGSSAAPACGNAPCSARPTAGGATTGSGRPWRHRARAFQPRSTLHGPARPTRVTTGTGSGKTESFLIPILGHCRRERARHRPGQPDQRLPDPAGPGRCRLGAVHRRYPRGRPRVVDPAVRERAEAVEPHNPPIVPCTGKSFLDIIVVLPLERRLRLRAPVAGMGGHASPGPRRPSRRGPARNGPSPSGQNSPGALWTARRADAEAAPVKQGPPPVRGPESWKRPGRSRLRVRTVVETRQWDSLPAPTPAFFRGVRT